MPISRYQIRNPYGLADPELYRSADRDDPEAILEGVAMAGLVGILRQLGDLAEFAAEIFHDLHEEVMATAARGHGLTIRVQQVEAEFPSIEKALLSQTSHSHFTKNAGVEWHANLKMDQNLITTGDMPRFLMDSYEECRGPPRLFLLDKFDVAGAGACLKRYSDPSFFKTELAYSKKKKAEVQREIKARKGKKKGGRWRNGDTPEIFSTSHFNSTLRQLFSDENDNTSKKVPIHAVKLKRKHLNGFSLNSTNGRSYMEHILDISPAKNDVLYENSVHRTSELVPEVREIGMEDFARKLLQIEGTQIPSPKKQEIHEPSPDELCQGEVNEQALESMPEPATKFDEENIPSTLLQISQKDAIDDGERNIEAREIEVEKIPFAFHQEDENDELFKGESKMEDDANRYGYDETELDKLPPALSQVCQNVSDVDIESQTGAGADGEGSVEFEAEKIHATIYPVDQKDVLGAKSKIQGSDDEYGSDDEEKIHSVVYPVDQKDVLHDGESKTETSDGGYGSDDAASEIENYMDALTTMESEMETDTESRAKHEKSFLNVVNQGTDSDTNEEKHYLHDLPDALSIGNSSTLCDWNGSLKKQRFSCSDSDTLSNSADMQMLEGNGNASLDIHEKFEKLFKFEDAMSGPQNESSCFGFADKLPSPSNVDAAAEAYVSAKMSLTQVHDKSPEKLHDKSPEELTSIDVLGTKPSESLAPNGNGTELSEVPHFISESGEVSCSSCITKEAVTLIHSSPSASLSEIQLVGTDTTEISSSNTEAMGKHSGNDLLQMPEVSSVHYQMEEARVSDCSKSSSSCRLLDGDVHDVTSAALAHSSDISAMPQGVEDVEDCSAAARLIVGSLDCTSQATGISDLPLGTPDNTIPEKVPTGYIDDSSSAAGGENPTEEMLDLPNFKNSSIEEELLSSIKQDKDAYSDVTSPPECLSFTQMDTIDALPNSLSLEMESGVLPSGPAVNLWESAEFGELENQKTATGIVPYEYENSVTESHESDDVDASEVPAACGGMETLLFVEKEELCNASDIKVKDKPANFPSKSPNEVLPVEVLAHTNDSATRSVFKESDCNDQGRMVGSPASSDHHVWLQEESLPSETASDHCKIEISETPIREDNVALDAQRVTAFALSDYESNQQAVDLTDPAAQPGHIDSRDPIVSEFLNHAYHPLSFRDAQIHLHAIGDSDVSVPSRGGNQDLEQESRESNQALAPKSPDQNHPHQSEKDAVSPFTHFLPEPSVPLEKSLELKGGILDVASSNEEEEGLESSDLLRGRKESPKEMDPPITYEYDYSKVHTESSSVDHLVWQASESKLKSDSLAVAASGMINGPTISSLDVSPCTSLEPEACMQLPASHSNAMLELPVSLLDSDAMATSSPVFPTVSMCNPETTYELQMSRPILGFPLPEPNLLNHSLEDMPPLPPLPPLEWRIGKLRHGFLPFGGEDLHPTHPFLPVETIQAEKTQQPSNPFLPPHTVEVDKPEQPLNAFEPIPTKEDEKTLNDSITLWSEIVEPPNSFPRTENVADEELQHVSRAPVEEIGQPPKSSTTPPIVEDEKPLHGLQTLEGNVGQSTNPLVPPETIEEEKPNGVTQLEATRPRDPLIEAVAAHDRSMLRKVSEHLRKEVKPKSDERDSLLEQIRAKSFNLKPTAAVKPTIQGPRANLNVVAILEKANAIRQAFAGSDEDDDTDSWSDC